MRQKILLPIVSLAFAGLTIFLGYFAQRTDFQSFIAAFGLFFVAYVWLVFYPKPAHSRVQMRQWIGLGIALRMLLLFSIPNLSDDYARFLWDGHLSMAGIHPFVHVPQYFMEQPLLPVGISAELFGKLNSPEYFTVYPPVCQGVFVLAVWLFPTCELGGVFILKLFLLACEIGTIMVLANGFGSKKRSDDALNQSLMYALNPLAILEVCGNCHFEGAMVFFLLLGIRAIQKGKTTQAALWWAVATATKMLPLLLLPIVWRWLGWRKGFIFNGLFGIFSLILFTPLWAVLPNILNSLDLYFRKFQFNASFYYLVREVGIWKTGWDIGTRSGPILGGLTVLGVLIIALFSKPIRNSSIGTHQSPMDAGRFYGALTFALFLYLSFSATIQPWYVLVPMVFSLGTSWRFMVLWSGLVMLSYSHYDGGGRQEHFGLITLEYSLVWGCLIWELIQRINRRQ